MSSDRMMQEVEAGQRWLDAQGVQVAPPAGCIERVKLRVQIAIYEAWLAEQPLDVPTPAVLEAVKKTVASEMANSESRETNTESAKRETKKPRRIYRMFTATAAAAVLLIATGLGIRSALSPAEVRPSEEAFTQLVEVIGQDFDEEETEWAAIEQELGSLEATLAEGYVSQWDASFPDDWNDQGDAPSNGLNAPLGTSGQGAI